MNIWHYLFDNKNNFDYDDTVVEIINNSAKLLNLGSGVYSTSNPYIEAKMVVYHEGLVGFSADETIAGSDSITYIISKENYWYYWDGAAWSISDETYAQSNISSDISTNFTTFFDSTTEYKTIMKVRMFLHSDAGTTTPSLSDIEIKYDFGEMLSYEDLEIDVQQLDLVRLSNDDGSLNDFVYQAIVNQCIEKAEAIIKTELQAVYKFPLLQKSSSFANIATLLMLYYLNERKMNPTEILETYYNLAMNKLARLKSTENTLDIDTGNIVFQDAVVQKTPYISTVELIFTDEILNVF